MNFYPLLLVLVTLVWGTTFALLKSAAQHLSGLEISVARFIVAALCMSPFVLKLRLAVWRDGALLGSMGLVSYVSQAYGLQFISSDRSAFLTSLNVLFVPLLSWFMGGQLNFKIVFAALLACGGIGLMSWGGGSSLPGDGATVISALAYASYVLMLSRMTLKHPSRELVTTQIVMMALIGVVLLPFEGLAQVASLPARALTVWPVILFLGAVATAAMLFLQAQGQKRVSAARAALIYALEPAFAALFSWLLLGEQLGLRAALGGAILVAAVLLSEL